MSVHVPRAREGNAGGDGAAAERRNSECSEGSDRSFVSAGSALCRLRPRSHRSVLDFGTPGSWREEALPNAAKPRERQASAVQPADDALARRLLNPKEGADHFEKLTEALFQFTPRHVRFMQDQKAIEEREEVEAERRLEEEMQAKLRLLAEKAKFAVRTAKVFKEPQVDLAVAGEQAYTRLKELLAEEGGASLSHLPSAANAAKDCLLVSHT